MSIGNKAIIINLALIVSTSLLLAPTASGEESDKWINEIFAQAGKDCKDYGRVLADARFSKLQKNGNDPRRKYGNDAYTIIANAMELQCTSIFRVIVLRLLKSEMSAEKALRLDIDKEILKHMEIIEKTL